MSGDEIAVRPDSWSVKDHARWWILQPECGETSRSHIEALLAEHVALETRVSEEERKLEILRRWGEAFSEYGAVLQETLQGAKKTIRLAQMRYEHPLVEHPWGRCGCVSCDGIRAINDALSSPPPTETPE